jgi:hypothetical protein
MSKKGWLGYSGSLIDLDLPKRATRFIIIKLTSILQLESVERHFEKSS